jgi:opacity protein-like surface antigen
MSVIKPIILSFFIAIPAVASAADWEGAYAGVQAGGSSIGTNSSIKGDGGSFGAFAGYNFAVGPAILGAKIDYDATSCRVATAKSTLRPI